MYQGRDALIFEESVALGVSLGMKTMLAKAEQRTEGNGFLQTAASLAQARDSLWAFQFHELILLFELTIPSLVPERPSAMLALFHPMEAGALQGVIISFLLTSTAPLGPLPPL